MQMLGALEKSLGPDCELEPGGNLVYEEGEDSDQKNR
jgi:hypothetical protein